MDPRAVEKAQSRLRVAKKAIADLRSSKTYGEFSDHWYVFLTSAKNVYTVLEQGAKTTPQSRQWFGGIANIRRNDPLLQCLYEARNDDEHGLGSSIDLSPEKYEIGAAGDGYSQHVRLDGGPFQNVVVKGFGGAAVVYEGGAPPPGIKATALDGKPVLSRRTPASAILVNVEARGNRVLPPPETHLGQPLPDRSPLAVASIAADYLGRLIEQASRLA